MIKTIKDKDGKKLTIVYLKGNMIPCEQKEATLIKVMDGKGSRWYTPEKQSIMEKLESLFLRPDRTHPEHIHHSHGPKLKEIHKIVKSMGYDHTKVRYIAPEEHEINNKRPEKQAVYNEMGPTRLSGLAYKKSGIIGIDHTLPIDQVHGILAHEIHHQKWNGVQRKILTHLVGNKKVDTMNKLVESDGVTPYSKAFWNGLNKFKDIDEVRNNPDKFSKYWDATKETLAEIARLKETNSPEVDKIKPEWHNLFNTVEKFHQESDNPLFVK
jgi:uncharacterized protein (UPF0335 family)